MMDIQPSAAAVHCRQACAMHWRGLACAQDEPPDNERAIMWVAKAAAQGQAIAKRQMAALVARAVGGG